VAVLMVVDVLVQKWPHKPAGLTPYLNQRCQCLCGGH